MSSPLTARLAEVRRQLRGVALITALSWCLLTLLALLAAFFLLDWALLPHLVDPGNLERGTRALLILGALATLAWVAAGTLMRELRCVRSDDQIAMRVERAHTVLDGRLISAVQLHRGRELAIASGASAQHVSAELILALTRETQNHSQALDFGAVVDRRSCARIVAAAATVLLIAGVLVLVRRDLAGVLCERLLLGSEPYPTAVAILRVEAASLTGRGDPYPITIEVDAARTVPTTALAMVQPVTGPAISLPLVRQPGVIDGKVRFVGSLENALDDFSVRIQAQDARWPVIAVHVHERPMISDVSASCTFPDYLARPAETISAADLRVPIGTIVHLHAATTEPVVAAQLVLAEHQGAADRPAQDLEHATAMSLDAARTSCDAEFTVQADSSLSLRLRDSEGFSNSEPIAYRVTAIPDRAPNVSIQFPGHDKLATKTAQWPIRFTVRDDHGIVQGWIRFQIVSNTDATSDAAAATDPASAPATASTSTAIQSIGITGLAEPGELEVHREVILNLAKLKVSEGQRVIYWIEAEDNCRPKANRGVSPHFVFTVVDQANLSDRFEHDKSQILGGIQTLRDRQSQMKDAVDTIRQVAP